MTAEQRAGDCQSQIDFRVQGAHLHLQAATEAARGGLWLGRAPWLCNPSAPDAVSVHWNKRE